MTLLVEHDWVECMTWPAMAVPSAVRFLPAVLNLWFYKPFFFFFFFCAECEVAIRRHAESCHVLAVTFFKLFN